MIINQNHPSFGCKQAYFLFGMIENGIYKKTILVEAKNPWAIQVIEKISISEKVNEKCFLLAVFRESYDVGMRHDSIDEISYVDFILDIVDSSLILADMSTSYAFQRSLTREEVDYAKRKMDSTQYGVDKSDFEENTMTMTQSMDPSVARAIVEEQTSNRKSRFENYEVYQTAMSALTGLGYKKQQVKNALDKFGIEIFNYELSELMKVVLRRLQVS